MISPEILRRFPLFPGLDQAALKELAMMSEEVAYKNGEWIFHEGDDAEALYFVLFGSVDLRLAVDEERAVYADLSRRGAGELIGWSAIVRPYVYQMGAIAIQNVRLVRIDGQRLRAFVEEHPDVGYAVMNNIAEVIADRLNKLQVRFVSMADHQYVG